MLKKVADEADKTRELLERIETLERANKILTHEMIRQGLSISMSDIETTTRTTMESVLTFQIFYANRVSSGTCFAIEVPGAHGKKFDPDVRYFLTNQHVLNQKRMDEVKGIVIGTPPHVVDPKPEVNKTVRLLGEDEQNDVAIFSVPKKDAGDIPGLPIRNLKTNPLFFGPGTPGVVVGYPQDTFRSHPVFISDTNAFVRHKGRPPSPVLTYTRGMEHGSSGSPLVVPRADFNEKGERQLHAEVVGIHALGFEGRILDAAYTSSAMFKLLEKAEIIVPQDVEIREPDAQSPIIDGDVLSDTNKGIFESLNELAVRSDRHSVFIGSAIIAVLGIGAIGLTVEITKGAWKTGKWMTRKIKAGRSKAVETPKPPVDPRESTVADECLPDTRIPS